jgi:hypothetical protein
MDHQQEALAMGQKKKDRNMRSAEDRREKQNGAGRNSAKTRGGTVTAERKNTGTAARSKG